MNLIKMPRVEEITGLTISAIRQKIPNGNFPKPNYNKSKIHKWDEKIIIQWQRDFENKVMELNGKGYMPNTIAGRVNSCADRIISVIEKNGGKVNSRERPVGKNYFHLVLQISARLNNNRGI